MTNERILPRNSIIFEFELNPFNGGDFYDKIEFLGKYENYK